MVSPKVLLALFLGSSPGFACSSHQSPDATTSPKSDSKDTVGCASGSLEVVRATSPLPGADAVDTQVDILSSRSFRSRVPNVTSAVRFEIERREQSAVLAIEARAHSEEAAASACNAFLATAMYDEALEQTRRVLLDEAESLQGELAEIASELEEFRSEHETPVRLEERIELASVAIRQLETAHEKSRGKKKAAIQAELDQLKEEAVALNLRSIEKASLLRRQEASAAKLELVMTHIENADVPFRAIDTCRPVACPNT